MSSSNMSYVFKDASFDIYDSKRGNLPFLVVDNTLFLHFSAPEDLAEFVKIVSELEIAYETFQADKEEKGALA